MTESPVAVVSATINCSAADAFRAWIDPAILPLWLAPPPYDLIHAEVDPTVGGRYRHDVVGPDGKHVVTGEYIAVKPGREIQKSWNYSGPNPAPRKEPTFVRVEISAHSDEGVQVTISHSGLRDGAEHRHYQEGWSECLRRLQQMHAEL